MCKKAKRKEARHINVSGHFKKKTKIKKPYTRPVFKKEEGSPLFFLRFFDAVCRAF
jgi:hypothetical protein